MPTENKILPLREMQSLMAAEIMRPYECALTAATNSLMKPNNKLTGPQRLQIYHEQYWLRLLESIQEDFPGLIAILGQERFEALSIAYLTRYPSSSYTLNNLGKNLANFILECPDLTMPETQLAYEMACVEWAEMIAASAETKEAIGPESLHNADPSNLVLQLQPYLTILKLDYALDNFLLTLDKQFAKSVESNAFISRNKQFSKISRPRKRQTFLAVHRLNNKIFYKRLNKEEFLLLKELMSGKTLAAACHELISQEKNPEKINNFPAKLQQYFSTWMELSWFCEAKRLK